MKKFIEKPYITLGYQHPPILTAQKSGGFPGGASGKEPACQ